MNNPDSTAAISTRVVHNLQRNGTKLLTQAAAHPSASTDALSQLRDCLVSQLRSHHESEDAWLWPLLTGRSPELAGAFAELSSEHEKLDAALDALAAAPVDGPDHSVLLDAAVVLRDLVHTHLDHEEPVLLPALTDHLSAPEWAEFAKQVAAEEPNPSPHLVVWLLQQSGTPQETETILGAIPAPVRDALLEQAQTTIAQLH